MKLAPASILILALAWPAAGQGVHTTTGDLELVWETTSDGSGGKDDRCVALARSDARVFALGSTADAKSGLDLLVVAYDATGTTELWSSTWDGPSSLDDQPVGIAVSPDGARVVVTARTATPGFDDDVATIALDAATGAELWSTVHGGADQETASAVAIDPAGARAFVSATIVAPGAGTDLAAFAYDLGTGALLWSQSYDGPASSLDSAADVTASSDGTRIVVGGTIQVAGLDHDLITIAYDAASGAQLWASTADAAGGRDVAVAIDTAGGSVLITGWATTLLDPVGVLTVAYDVASGAELWRDVAADGNPPRDLAVTPGGGLAVVAGSTPVGSGWQALAIAYDPATGARVWTGTVSGAPDFLFTAVAVAFDGAAAYVAIDTLGSEDGNFTAAAFDLATGATLGVAMDVGQKADQAVDVLVGPAGDVLVGGQAWQPAGGGDLMLLELAGGALSVVSAHDEVVSAADVATAVALSSDESLLFVAGSASALLSGGALRILALDAATGATVWEAAPSAGAGTAAKVAVGPDPTVAYVAATVRPPLADHEVVLFALDAASGATLWQAPIGPGVDPFNYPGLVDAAVAPDGRTVFCSAPTGGEGAWGHDAALVALDAATGAELWRSTSGDPEETDRPKSIAISADGARIAIAGTRTRYLAPFMFTTYDLVTWVFDAATGAELWEAREEPGPWPLFLGFRSARAAFTPDGSRVIVAADQDFTVPVETRAYATETGAPLWTAPSETAEIAALAISACGGHAFLAGEAPNGSGMRVSAIDLGAGSELWTATHAGAGGFAGARAIAVDAAARTVLVAGWISDTGTSAREVYALALDAATGAERGSARFLGAGGTSYPSGAAGLALADGGRRLLVAGTAEGAGTWGDACALAYDVEAGALAVAPGSVSLSAGGSAGYALSSGLCTAGKGYWLLGALGTGGLSIGGVTLPLQLDPYFLHTVHHAGMPPLTGSFGLLDAGGKGAALFALPPGMPASLAGTTVHHAYVAFDAATLGVAFVSEPAGVLLTL